MILRWIRSLWKMSFARYYQINRQTYSTVNTHKSKEEKCHRHHYFYQIYIIVIVLNIVFSCFVIHLIFFVAPAVETTASAVNENYELKSDIVLSNRSKDSIHYIYIDIGCFDGETVEHFIHFTPNSSLYDIITFEPDPNNYRLCEERLRQTKYSNRNIIILPKVAWIRDEKIDFQIDRGRKSRINSNKTGK
jgi:hypothetical protein